jgi:hypothetical protein
MTSMQCKFPYSMLGNNFFYYVWIIDNYMFIPLLKFSKLSCQYLYVQRGSNNMFFRGREKQSKSSLKSYLNTTEQFIIPAQ